MTTNILLALFVYFVLPETRKVALEDMDSLFGGVSHTKKGATMIKLEDAKAVNQPQAVEVETSSMQGRK
jgi:hypothetical protein